MGLRPDSNDHPHVYDHAGLVCDTADIARDVDWLPEFEIGAITSGFDGHDIEFR